MRPRRTARKRHRLDARQHLEACNQLVQVCLLTCVVISDQAGTDAESDEFLTADLGDLNFVTLTRYHEMFADTPSAFPPLEGLESTLGQITSRHQLRQLRVAESEKFAHITTFLK